MQTLIIKNLIYISTENSDNQIDKLHSREYMNIIIKNITDALDKDGLEISKTVKLLMKLYSHQTTPLLFYKLLDWLDENSLHNYFPIYKDLTPLNLDLRIESNNFYLYFKIIFNLIKLGIYGKRRYLLLNYKIKEPKNNEDNIKFIEKYMTTQYEDNFDLKIEDKIITKILTCFFLLFLGRYNLFPFLEKIDNFNRYKELNLNFLEIFYDNILEQDAILGGSDEELKKDFLKDAKLICFFLQDENNKLENGYYRDDIKNYPDFVYEITNTENRTYLITKSWRNEIDDTPKTIYNKYKLKFIPKEIFNGKIINIKEYFKNLFWFYEKIDQPPIFRFVQFLYNADYNMLKDLDDYDLTNDNFDHDKFDKKIFGLYLFFTTNLNENDSTFDEFYLKFSKLSDSIQENIIYWFFDIILNYDLDNGNNMFSHINMIFLDFNTLITFLLESGHNNDNRESNNKIFISWTGESVNIQLESILKEEISEKDTIGHNSNLLLFFRKYYMKSSVSKINIDHNYIIDGLKNKYEKDHINIEKYTADITKLDCVRLK